MKITRELLQKYGCGECTDEEIQFIESWIPGESDITTNFDSTFSDQAEETVWNNLVSQHQLDKSASNHHSNSSTRIFKIFARVSVAACFLFASFFGGRLSAKSISKGKVETFAYKEHLYVFGGQNIVTNLPGTRFDIHFKGSLQLFNASKKEQTIVTGDSTFLLPAGAIQYLTGSSAKPKLTMDQEEMESNGRLGVSDFSILSTIK